MKQTIAVDVDDVLAQHAQEFVKFSNQNYGTNLTVEDYNDTDRWADLWQVDHKEAQKRAELFRSSTHIKEMARFSDADEVLKKLAKKYKLIIITARRLELEQVTLQWLNQHYPSVFAEVRFVNLWPQHGEVMTKAEVAKGLNANYLIDDNPTQCFLAAHAGIKALLFGNYAWNRDVELIKGVIRVANWQEVQNYFDKLKSGHSG